MTEMQCRRGFKVFTKYECRRKRAISVNRVGEHGKPEELHRECGYDAKAIAEAGEGAGR